MPGPRKKKTKKRVARKVSPRVIEARAKRALKKLKRAPAAEKPSTDDALAMVRPDGKAGKGRGVPSSAFTRAEPAQAVEEAPSVVKTPPRWIYTMIERGATQEEVLERAHERLKRSPTKANHLLVQGLLQEFARAPRARVKIGELVTKQNVARFIGKGR